MTSGPEKYNEMEDLNKQILSMRVVPDFGYYDDLVREDAPTGWTMLYDYCKKEPRLQKLQNVVHNRLQEREVILRMRRQEEQFKKKKQNSDGTTNQIMINPMDLLEEEEKKKELAKLQKTSGQKMLDNLDELISIHDLDLKMVARIKG